MDNLEKGSEAATDLLETSRQACSLSGDVRARNAKRVGIRRWREIDRGVAYPQRSFRDPE